ncbi:unnamed protein product [Rhizoctonia solani]|uniref:Heterokaryon incompatibility domain-containing protein n=1 Tax=Rhizoctonia solani TaxID=456999 RepID=A0A8H3AID8_9AGAM|nr:unnamed protein product [Rhizoctonia solani]
MGDFIQTKQCDDQQEPVYEYELRNHEQLFDLSNVKARQYRFVDCASVLETKTIKIYAYQELPSVPPYTTVSYVWKGNKPDSKDTNGTFKVKGTDERVDARGLAGNPINIQILEDACSAARQQKTNLLWLDRLCMNKSDKADDDWQTGKMYEIYKRSKFCIVFPGGLERLTPLNEETGWIDRGWTLQEAVAPPEVQVMFKWDLGDSEAQPSLYGPTHAGWITEIAPDRCAMAPLLLLLDCTISGNLELINKDLRGPLQKYPVSMFGTTIPGVGIKADFRPVLPNVAALAVILKEQKRNNLQYYHSIWKSTMMRSTSRATDMIFSIMGLFGVNLDPAQYDDKDDCVKPAIDLVRRILDTKGTRAVWLGASFFSPPCPYISTFPSFPKIFPPGSQNHPTVAIPQQGRIRPPLLMLNEYPEFNALPPISSEKMDEEGYLTFIAKSAPVFDSQGNHATPSSQGSGYTLQAINGTTWVSSGGSPDGAEAFSVLLGCFTPYSPFENKKNPNYDAASVRGFIVVREPDNRENFYLDSYIMLNSNALDWISRWQYREFKVGGRHMLGAKVDYEENLPDFEIKNDLRLFQPIIPPPEIIPESAPYVGPGPPPTLAGGVVNRASTWLSGSASELASAVEDLLPSNAIGQEAGHTVKQAIVVDRMPPQRVYLSVGGDPWQEEGRWTSEAMKELRDRLMRSG